MTHPSVCPHPCSVLWLWSVPCRCRHPGQRGVATDTASAQAVIGVQECWDSGPSPAVGRKPVSVCHLRASLGRRPGVTQCGVTSIQIAHRVLTGGELRQHSGSSTAVNKKGFAKQNSGASIICLCRIKRLEQFSFISFKSGFQFFLFVVFLPTAVIHTLE